MDCTAASSILSECRSTRPTNFQFCHRARRRIDSFNLASFPQQTAGLTAVLLPLEAPQGASLARNETSCKIVNTEHTMDERCKLRLLSVTELAKCTALGTAGVSKHAWWSVSSASSAIASFEDSRLPLGSQSS